MIRYFVIDTLKWLPGQKVLVSPSSFDSVDLVDNKISVLATKEQIENSPSIEEHQPLSRQKETELHSYYGWAPYWIGSGLWGMSNVPSIAEQQRELQNDREPDDETDAALRSINEIKGQITGYNVMGTDKKIGHVVDFVIDDHSWAIHSLIVDTGSWLPGRKVALATESIESIDWVSKEIITNLTSNDVEKNSSTNDSISELDGIPIDRFK